MGTQVFAMVLKAEVLGRSLEVPGSPWRSLGVLGGPWRSLEAPGGPWESLGSLEVPGGPFSIEFVIEKETNLDWVEPGLGMLGFY